MTSPLRILHLEDDPHDAALVQSTIEAAGIPCAITRVQDRGAFVAALERGGIDLILSDFTLPAFDGLAAADIVRTRWPGIPLILVSGTIGEERAIDALKGGATDYVLKERLTRLVPAVRRALADVDARADRLRLEAQFLEAQKRDVIGQFTAGVAHDFNNVLAVIMGYTDVISSALDPASPLQRHVEEIRLASERAAGLARQLLVFGRTQTVQPVVLDVNAVVKDLGNMLRRLLDENIAVTFVPGASLGRIRADPGYVGQLLMNLVVNARDAMPNGGTLTIATSNTTVETEYAHGHAGVLPGDYVELRVSDTGTGMTEQVKARLFEPFFTTKPQGKGTGLGLATCQTIVRQSGGYIDVDSEIGRGTTFRVLLPRVQQALDVPAKPVQAGPLPRGTETLLLVEDEPSVRQLIRGVLISQGYEVLSASNGEDGLRMALEHRGAPIELIITDVVMPLMGGRAMAERVKAAYPGLRVLFTSGYTGAAGARHDASVPAGGYLAKPYTPRTLVCKVREMLDEPA